MVAHMKLLWALVYLTVIHLNKVVETTDNGNGLTGSTSTSTTTTNSNVKKVVVDGSEVDNGCGCTCKNFWCGLFTCGIYNCYKHHKYKSESKSENEFTSDCSDKTAVTLDINKKSTDHFDYEKKDDVVTYTAKEKFVFNKITQSITIWQTKNPNVCATKVELRGTSTLIVYFGDENRKKTFKKKDNIVQVKWEEVKTQTGSGTSATPATN